MTKLKLNLSDLKVETFETKITQKDRGTVNGNVHPQTCHQETCQEECDDLDSKTPYCSGFKTLCGGPICA